LEERRSNTDKIQRRGGDASIRAQEEDIVVVPANVKESLLTSKDVNIILSIVLFTKPVAKKLRMGVSPSKVINPKPISYTIPYTFSVV